MVTDAPRRWWWPAEGMLNDMLARYGATPDAGVEMQNVEAICASAPELQQRAADILAPLRSPGEGEQWLASPQLAARLRKGLGDLRALQAGGFVVVTTGAQCGGAALARRPELITKGLRLQQDNTPTMETCFLEHEHAASFYTKEVVQFFANVFAAFAAHAQHQVLLFVPEVEEPYTQAYVSTTLAFFVKAYAAFSGGPVARGTHVLVYCYYCQGVDAAAPDVSIAPERLQCWTLDVIGAALEEDWEDSVRYCVRRSGPPPQGAAVSTLTSAATALWQPGKVLIEPRGSCGKRVQEDGQWYSLFCARPGLEASHAFTAPQVLRVLRAATHHNFTYSDPTEERLDWIDALAMTYVAV